MPKHKTKQNKSVQLRGKHLYHRLKENGWPQQTVNANNENGYDEIAE